jgi:hypothetical protein
MRVKTRISSHGFSGRRRRRGRNLKESLIPSIVDPRIAADDPARFGQSLRECSDQCRRFWIVCPDIHQHVDAPHVFALLRTRHERPRRGRASNCYDESAPSHEGALGGQHSTTSKERCAAQQIRPLDFR